MAVSATASQVNNRFLTSGEVGLLGEEIPQRLLSILVESACACLRQIHGMSTEHGTAKVASLYKVGLNVVVHWDSEIVQEEVVRMETTYPEITALHSYTYLWLLDKIFSDKEISNIAVPTLPDLYSIFMRRVVQHMDVTRDVNFINSPFAFQRAVYIDAFRGAYHDLIQKSTRQSRFQMAIPCKRLDNLDSEITCDDAPSEVAARLSTVSQTKKETQDSKEHLKTKTTISNSGQQLTTVNLDKINSEKKEAGRESNEAKKTENAEVGTSAPSKMTDRTRALTIQGPCFFNSTTEKEKEESV